MKLTIATANSRRDKLWKNKEMTWAEFIERVQVTVRTSESVAEYRQLSKAKQDEIKDVGGFVGGKLRDGKRKNGYVEFRSMLTLDMDYAQLGIWEELCLFFDFTCCLYSTHKHTPDKPRLRLIIPLTRTVTADEYSAVARKVACDIGIEQFDDTTYEPSRLMYWASTSSDGEFEFAQQNGVLLDPDKILATYTDWRDTSGWPVSSRQRAIVKHTLAKKADPLEEVSVIGAFCRAYSVQEAIDTFIPEINKPSVMPGRYDYLPADSAAGVLIYEDKFAFSHHATDPACGKLCNAFDLVRLHKFGELDTKADEDTSPSKLPSFKAMQEFVTADEGVKRQLAQQRQEQANSEFQVEADDWQTLLELDKKGTVLNTLKNLILILRNDNNLQPIVFNQLGDSIEIKGTVPWTNEHKWWRDADDAQLWSAILTETTEALRPETMMWL